MARELPSNPPHAAGGRTSMGCSEMTVLTLFIDILLLQVRDL
jgi:hypothetical protein